MTAQHPGVLGPIAASRNCGQPLSLDADRERGKLPFPMRDEHWRLCANGIHVESGQKTASLQLKQFF